jgi:hypothetical protein
VGSRARRAPATTSPDAAVAAAQHPGAGSTATRARRRSAVHVPRRAGAGQRGEAGARFVAYHSVENFRAHWTAALRNRLGLPEHPDRRSWDWVTEGR